MTDRIIPKLGKCKQCSRLYKNLFVCSTCSKKACLQCSQKTQCIDCYVKQQASNEIEFYHNGSRLKTIKGNTGGYYTI